MELDDILCSTIDELDKSNQHIIFDTKNTTIFKNDKKIKLTKNEILLLNFLIGKTDGIISYEDIINHIWEDEIQTNIDIKNKLRILISRLNKKIDCEIIISTYGVGYQFNYEDVVVLK